jgi:leucyl-tRNA synthetase
VKFNTAIATMMKFLNEWERYPAKEPARFDKFNKDRTSQVNRDRRRLSIDHAKQFLQLLAPLAPFITEEIWHEVFGEKQSIHLSSWPKMEEKVTEEEVTIPIQVNGKLRATIKMSKTNLSATAVTNRSLEEEKVKKYLKGKKYKIIYVPGKILNFVTTPRITPTRCK